MIDDISIGTGPAGPMGPSASYGMNPKQHFDEQSQRIQYSMPGILHFLQTEWARFEMERAQWEVERAELQARVAFLQGERKGQENLKQDLVRRIKMLEFALKQERAKFHKFKYGADQPPLDAKLLDAKEESLLDDPPNSVPSTNNLQSWRQGRQLLRQYLQEIGYTDAVLDVRSSRVLQAPAATNGDGDSTEDNQRKSAILIKSASSKTGAAAAQANEGERESEMMDSEASVLAQFDFQPGTVVDDEDDSDEENEGEDADDDQAERQRIVSSMPSADDGPLEDEIDAETEDALAVFDFLGPESGESEPRPADREEDWNHATEGANADWSVNHQLIDKLKAQYKKDRTTGVGGGFKPKKESASPDVASQQPQPPSQQRPKRSSLQAMIANLNVGEGEEMHRSETDTNAGSSLPGHTGFSLPAGTKGLGGGVSGKGSEEDAFSLGDLADITVGNDVSDAAGGQFEAGNAVNQDGFRKTWVAKYTLRSHFDGIRALSFHPVEPVLLTASEDQTLKLWNLQKTVPSKKTAVLDVEPVYTFRGHVGAVLCLAASATGEQCYSGGVDATVRCWNIPSSSLDPYDSFDSSVLHDTLVAHTDAVWGLAVHSTRMQLLSCSADGTVRLWSPSQRAPPLLHTYTPPETDDGVPTCVDFLTNEPHQMMAAYTSGNIYIYDLETGKVVVKLNSKSADSAGGSNQINKIVNHPTLPLTMSAHDDKHIKFYDSSSGQLVHSMVAHLDAVTSLAVDPNGLYLLSGIAPATTVKEATDEAAWLLSTKKKGTVKLKFPQNV